MISTRIITSQMLFEIVRAQVFDTPYFTEEDMSWHISIAPNAVHIIDHYVMLNTGVKCRVLCVHRDSDEPHEHVVLLTHAQFAALPTADEFSRQLQQETDANE